MKRSTLKSCFVLVTVIGLLSPAAAKEEAKWVCEAEDLEDYSYDGSSTAYIHLSAYSNGHDYVVTLNGEKTVAKGLTSDGTPFTCTKQDKAA